MTEEKNKLMWLDGELIPWSSATVSIATHALHYASSVFEGIRSYNGRTFKMHEHYERFHQSAKGIGFDLPFSIKEFEDATKSVVQNENCNHLYIRPLAWCGSNKMTVASRGIDVHVAVMAWDRPLNRNPSAARLIESRWKRPDPQTAPVHSKASGLYMISTMSKNEAEIQGYDDALLLDHRGYIAEASSSNFFIVKNSKLITPIPHSFLNGITRLTVIDLAKTLGIPVEERDLELKDLAGATEAFLTGTAIEILPVSEIRCSQGGFVFKEKAITNRLQQAFYQLTN